MPSGVTMQAGANFASTSKTTFRADIQGLRAIAVLLVVAYHSGLSWLGGGYVGVDVFFVISGFLITGHLVGALEREGSIRFGAFYAKRARRILPAALSVAVLTTLASWFWMPPLLMKEVWQGAVATALYVPNIFFAIQGTNYLGESTPSVFQHYWSLGVEEQFYVFWPLILGFAFLVLKGNRRALFCLIIALTLVSFALCLFGMEFSQSWTFFSLPTRAWELGVGGLAAFLVRSDASWLKRPTTGVLTWLGLISLLIISLTFDSSTPFPGPYAIFPVLATGLLIIGGGAASKFSSDRLLALKPFQFLGKISYSLYLVHWPLQVIPQTVTGGNDPLPLELRLTLGLVSIPLAWLLYRWIEIPAMKIGILSDCRNRRTLFCSILASVLVIAIAYGAVSNSNRLQLSVDQSAIETQVGAFPKGTPFVPSNLEPSLRFASEDNPEVYGDGCHRGFDSTDASGCQMGPNKSAPLVFLFGDSHAASWYPALERLAGEGVIRLDSNTKSSCPSVDIPILRDGSMYRECQEWRDSVVQRIVSQHPDLVVLANYGAATLVGGNTNFAQRWQDGLESIVATMSGIDVAILSDVPTQPGSPSICLSANLNSTESCDGERSAVVSENIIFAEQAAAQSTGAYYANLLPYLCNKKTCPVIIGNNLVYRDAHHLTASFSRKLAPQIWKELEKATR
ncbi:Peptidoglycan/LPS O-acetylase OafA/YrhL, contains acyltransferase and SGNH-hydrolase domains [Arthrobacter alpinus]|uniref:Peptidoglycan/LPS O-acetylase OafA/YrhL, contains acyltransferase and SGNH-hydrolase domains n=1 Tax=Arthrobacter alpinus TaxID=656366 RepID=A0A1H5KGX3_9MICC|nr:acyltransferase family protein [Arthrobacter alpinus]SEE64106.1 Peptidoglycan/LPS O-acetylase OafA/YrhL, contains acyltransferase and SGNH-hydrolase domains [Arthrobacter alpinus]